MQPVTVNADTYADYLKDGKDFIDDAALKAALAAPAPSADRVRGILARSLAVSEALPPEDAAALLAVEDPALLEEIFQAARDVKRKVYDNRVITFAPLYASNFCVNNCLYCGFRTGNAGAVLRFLLAVGALLPDTMFVTDRPDSLGKRPNGDLLDALEQLGDPLQREQSERDRDDGFEGINGRREHRPAHFQRLP